MCKSVVTQVQSFRLYLYGRRARGQDTRLLAVFHRATNARARRGASSFPFATLSSASRSLRDAIQMNCGCARCPSDTGRMACDFPNDKFENMPVSHVLRHAREQMRLKGNPAGVLSDNGISQAALLAEPYIGEPYSRQREAEPIVGEFVERDEGGATIRLCLLHNWEKCMPEPMAMRGLGHDTICNLYCLRDFSGLNAAERKRVKDKEAVRNAYRDMGFQPRQILGWSAPGQPLKCHTELPPGTRLTCINRSGDGRPDSLCELISLKQPSKRFNGRNVDEKKMGKYKIRFLDSGELCNVLCDDVHDPAQWRIHSMSLSSMAETLLHGQSTHGGSQQRSSDIAEAADDDGIASVSTTPTATVPVRTTVHAQKRFIDRGITHRDFQSAVKAHLNMRDTQPEALLPGLPNRHGPTVLLIHDDCVFCTDPQLTVEISCWRMLKQGDIALIHDLQRRRDLNHKTCRLVSYSDGRWACKLEEEDILLRIALKNLKPFSSTIDVCLEELAAVELV